MHCKTADLSWSDEALSLKNQNRQLLQRPKKFREPWTVSGVSGQLKSLRLMDLNIGEVDSAFLTAGFSQLKELSLTGNHLARVANLPPSLDLLDLAANEYVPPLFQQS